MPFRNVNVEEFGEHNLGFPATIYDGGFAVPISRLLWMKAEPVGRSWVLRSYRGKFLVEGEIVRETLTPQDDELEALIDWLTHSDTDPTSELASMVRREIRAVKFWERCGNVAGSYNGVVVDKVSSDADGSLTVDGSLLEYLFTYRHHHTRAALQVYCSENGASVAEAEMRTTRDTTLAAIHENTHSDQLNSSDETTQFSGVDGYGDTYDTFNTLFPLLIAELQKPKPSWVFSATHASKNGDVDASGREIRRFVKAVDAEEATALLEQQMIDENIPASIQREILSVAPQQVTETAPHPEAGTVDPLKRIQQHVTPNSAERP